MATMAPAKAAAVGRGLSNGAQRGAGLRAPKLPVEAATLPESSEGVSGPTPGIGWAKIKGGGRDRGREGMPGDKSNRAAADDVGPPPRATLAAPSPHRAAPCRAAPRRPASLLCLHVVAAPSKPRTHSFY